MQAQRSGSVPHVGVSPCAVLGGAQDHSAAPEYDDGSPPAVRLKVAAGLGFDAAAKAIAAQRGARARVLEVEARDLPAFCGFEDAKAGARFDQSIARAFQNSVRLPARPRRG